jgi:hypothetical protein
MPIIQSPRSSKGNQLSPLQRGGVTLIVFLLAIILVLGLPLGSAGFVTESFAGAAVIFLVNWRSPRDWLAAAAIAALVGGIYKLSGAPVFPAFGWQLFFPAALYGVASLVVLFYRTAGTDGPEHDRLAVLLPTAALIPALCLGSTFAVLFDMRLRPYTYDRILYAFDRTLGFDPSFLMGRVFRGHLTFQFAAGLAYNSLPIGLCLLCAFWLWRRPAGAPDVRLVFAALGIVGFALYQFCPAAGPRYLFGAAYPDHAPLASALTMETVPLPGAARNAMPSLHVAWCLLGVYNSCWYRSWLLRIYALVALILTAASTLGLGEHYLVDLIVAVPLSVAVQLACSGKRWRSPRAWACLALVVAWEAVLRSGLAWHARPLASWSAIGLTLAASALLYRNRGNAPGEHSAPDGGRLVLEDVR